MAFPAVERRDSVVAMTPIAEFLAASVTSQASPRQIFFVNLAVIGAVLPLLVADYLFTPFIQQPHMRSAHVTCRCNALFLLCWQFDIRRC